MIESIEKMRDELRGKRDLHLLVPEFLEELDAIEREVEERYIELPKDANGEYIHVGDRVEDNERVARIVLADGDAEPSVYIEKLPSVLHEHFCSTIVHYHAPTVEDVLEDALNKAANLDREEGYWPSAADITNIVNEIAPKLQLREAE